MCEDTLHKGENDDNDNNIMHCEPPAEIVCDDQSTTEKS
jgi:hypothetical protein